MVRGNCHVILRGPEGHSKCVQVVKDKPPLKFGRLPPIPSALLLALPYGANIEHTEAGWSRASGDGEAAQTTEQIDERKDNRDLLLDGSAQGLSHGEILEMSSRCSGEKMVQALVENSETYGSKTRFSQQKYVAKKRNKHVKRVTLVKPTMLSLNELYLTKSKFKCRNLRFDYIRNLLCQANVRTNGTYLVLDCTPGLVSASVAQLLGGRGRVLRLFGSNFGGSMAKDLDLGDHANVIEYVLPEQVQGIPVDSFILAGSDVDMQFLDSAWALLPNLRLGGHLALFWDTMQPVVERHVELRESGEFVCLEMSQLWTREYQVLPQRTRPLMEASGALCSGFILSGIKIEGPPR